MTTTTLKTALHAATQSGTIALDNPALAIDLALSIPDAGMALDFLHDWRAGKPLGSWMEMLDEAVKASETETA